jgi:hypothetical protein
MKTLTAVCVISFSVLTAFAQTNAKLKLSRAPLPVQQQNLKLLKYDFSKLFTFTDNAYVYGFIGNDFQRIRIKIISIKKDAVCADVYRVYGKSMVKNNIDEFNGFITITTISEVKPMNYGVDDNLKNKGYKGEYVISGNYNFKENSNQPHSGVFKGSFHSKFYLDKNSDMHYDDIESYSDGYSNNTFVGTWVSYNKKQSKTCNWGDYRIPNSGGFDVGAVSFHRWGALVGKTYG